jgi:hypothetical protein
VLHDYIAALFQFERGFTTTSLDAVHAVDDRRAAASSDLRNALGLPASSCDIMRP